MRERPSLQDLKESCSEARGHRELEEDAWQNGIEQVDIFISEVTTSGNFLGTPLFHEDMPQRLRVCALWEISGREEP
jgi:hypothetical protein